MHITRILNGPLINKIMWILQKNQTWLTNLDNWLLLRNAWKIQNWPITRLLTPVGWTPQILVKLKTSFYKVYKISWSSVGLIKDRDLFMLSMLIHQRGVVEMFQLLSSLNLSTNSKTGNRILLPKLNVYLSRKWELSWTNKSKETTRNRCKHK